MSQSLDDLLTLFNIGKKSDVKTHCRKLVIKSEDFTNVILAANVGRLDPYEHIEHHKEITPAFLQLSEDEQEALGRSGLGQIKGKALKAVRKIDQIFKDRRLLSVHVFYDKSQSFWHMFYFDQRDHL